MFGRLGVPELLILLALMLVIFGPGKIGELGKGLGEGIRSFKKSVGQEEHDAPPEPATGGDKAA